MTFAELSEYLQRLENTASRNEITEILAEVFGKADKDEIDKICYLLLGRIAPQYTGIEFSLAEKMMLRAVSVAYVIDSVQILKEYKERGDLGDVTQDLAKEKGKSVERKLSVEEVFEKLWDVAKEGGSGSQERKLLGISELLKQADPLSAKYIVRIPVGKLRLGFSDITMLDALSMMLVGDKSGRKRIEGYYNVVSDIGHVARHAKEHKSLEAFDSAHPKPGVPVRTSLAERLPSADKIIEKVGPEVAVEPKYDGFRAQVHILKNGEEVSIFSRNHENVTEMFPEIAEAAKELSIKDAILDGEAIGYDPKTQQFALFQQTVQRKRKHNIDQKSAEIPLKVFVFDVLYLDGKDYMPEPFSERRKVLEKLFGSKAGTFMLTRQIVVDNSKDLKSAFEEYISEGLEGVMAKKIDAPYRAGGRGFHWVKYKKHTEGELSDTIDCVLMGAYRGRGKRASFGVGGFLIGVPGKDGNYYSLSNLGTGLSDEQFKKMYEKVSKLTVGEKPDSYVVDKMVEPDIWVKPKVVLEILADEITLSPRHTAGRGDDGKGYSLRFPRLKSERTDKDPEQATSVEEVKTLYKQQIGRS